MPESGPQANTRAAPTILALIAVFVLPIVVAWWLVAVRPPTSEDNLLNHGTLVRPPIDIAASPATGALEGVGLAPGEWAMVYLGAGRCEAACDEVLHKLVTIRSVLGRGATRVRVGALVDESGGTVTGTVAVADREARSAVSAALGERLTSDPHRAIVFLDWRGQIMMYFAADAPPGDIKQDIKRLLRASEIK